MFAKSRLAKLASAWRLAFTSLVGLLLLASGCNQAPTTPAAAIDSAVLSAHRGRLLLAEEPPGVMAVLDLREMFTGRSEADSDAELEQHFSADAAEISEIDEEIEFTADDVASEVSTPVAVEPQPVVVVGKIGGMPNPFTNTEPDFPWRKDSATLFLVDPATVAEMEESGHASADPEHVANCPFCARAARENVNSVAVVNFLDESGQVIPLPAGPLLDLQETETVVVRGTARLVGGTMLMIDADGVYVRR